MWDMFSQTLIKFNTSHFTLKKKKVKIQFHRENSTSNSNNFELLKVEKVSIK